MPVRRTATALIAAATAATLLTGAGAPALAAGTPGDAPAADEVRVALTTPRLLTSDLLPTEKRFPSWLQTPVQVLDGHNFCEEEALPLDDTQMRTFYNNEEGTALTQYAVRFPSKAAARKAVKRVKACFSSKNVLADLLNPGSVRVHRWGTYDVKDGLTLGDITHVGKNYRGVFLWGVGRDAEFVTVTEFGLETAGKAPKKAWKSLTKKALRRVAA